MREPLRAIQGYANVLKQDFAEGHLDKAGLYIGRIEAVAHRINTMVSDLLEFARLSRTEIATENVVVNDALHEVTAALHAEIQQAKARLQVEVPDDLTVRAHRQTVVQALTNLVSNAVKFVRPGAAPVVRIARGRALGTRTGVERSRAARRRDRLGHRARRRPGAGRGLRRAARETRRHGAAARRRQWLPTGMSAGLSLSFSRNTTKRAGFVRLALRPTVCTSRGPS